MQVHDISLPSCACTVMIVHNKNKKQEHKVQITMYLVGHQQQLLVRELADWDWDWDWDWGWDWDLDWDLDLDLQPRKKVYI